MDNHLAFVGFEVDVVGVCVARQQQNWVATVAAAVCC